MRVGCSGWHYKHWAGRVYPPKLPKDKWLQAYARRFDTVELNNTFYRLPEAEQFDRWAEQVPPGFVFAVKASRYLTHFKRLIDPQEPLERLLSRAARLGHALGPILYQLPPDWVPPLDRFDAFLRSLPRRVSPRGPALTHVVEFRDPRCYSPELLARLEHHGVTLCVHDMAGIESPRMLVGPSVYVRLHGYGSKYGGSYPPHVLQEWAAWLKDASRTGREGYVYFNNDRDAHAVYNAETLIELLPND